MMEESTQIQRKIIHVDMDCFYAAVELRDNPALKGKPIAVGGLPNKRSVLATCNYEARRYGLHSGMPTAHAVRFCPQLILLPVNMALYQKVSKQIRQIFYEYTDVIEPLSLDEAFLDVTGQQHCWGSATWMAEEIRQKIFKRYRLTASAGVAPNKFLAKVASDWNKPNGLFVVTPEEVTEFVKQLPVDKIFGVGKVTAKKLHAVGIKKCGDIQHYEKEELIQRFGNFGDRLYQLSRGEDNRPVEARRIRKSLSVETTYDRDLPTLSACFETLDALHQDLMRRLMRREHPPIRKQFIKIKFFDFTHTTAECLSLEPDRDIYKMLIHKGFERHKKPVRLLGLGVRF